MTPPHSDGGKGAAEAFHATDARPQAEDADCPQPDTCSPTRAARVERLEARVERLEAGVRIVASGHALLTQQMADVAITLRRQDERIDENVALLRGLRNDVKENTELTRGIRDAVVTARTTGKAVRWLAPTILGGAALFAILKGLAIDFTSWIKR